MIFFVVGVIGIIDGTQIKIQAPPTEHDLYPGILFYNRKGYYSINTQIICGADYKILNVNARYPGSVHDSGIWATSMIRNHLLENFNDGDRSSWILGDSGYPLEPWLMVPIKRNNLNIAEQSYNRSLRRIRNTVERTIGMFKSRFRCCLGHRALHYNPVKAAKIISACAILHNIYLEQGDNDEFIEDDEIPYENEGRPDGIHNVNLYHEGNATRQRIVNQYF